MPLVAHSALPTFERLRRAGEDVLDADRALHQDIRELHLGLLNMMPDAALEATERQFLRLVGSCNRIVQFHVHPFHVRGVERNGAARDYVAEHYERFEDVRRAGLDALIITGANPVEDDITREPFWDGLIEVLEWARESVCSTLMSCLASHAAFLEFYGIERQPLDRKQWGVYSHRVISAQHPLVNGVNTRFEAPHSRWNDAPCDALQDRGLRVLVQSAEAGMLLATSPDGLRNVYFQGHPEYDAVSLLKEYKREVSRYLAGSRAQYPPTPDHYFNGPAARYVEAFKDRVLAGGRDPRLLAEFPEAALLPYLDNTWTDTGKALFNNWLGLVYQLTHQDRRVAFMPEVDPDDPLGLRARECAPETTEPATC